MRIFLSYRRDDSSAHAGRLYDALVQHFGQSNVFQDVVAIGAGEDFTQAIDRALDDCDAALIVIGPHWLATSPDGVSRLHQPEDYVRIEVAAALTRDVKVVPVLVGGGAMPSMADLPESLRPLTRRQAAVLRDESWHEDVAVLVREVRGQPRQVQPAHRPRRLLPAMAGLGGLAAVTALAVVIMTGNGATESSNGEPERCTETGSWTALGPDGTASEEVRSETAIVKFTVEDARYRRLSEGEWEVRLHTVMENKKSENEEDHDHWNYDRLLVGGFPTEGVSCATVDDGPVPEGGKSRAEVGFIVNDDPIKGLTLDVDKDGAEGRIEISG